MIDGKLRYRVLLTGSVGLLGCTTSRTNPPEHEHPAERQSVSSPPVPSAASTALPPNAQGSLARLNSSPRHGEWVMIRSQGDSIRSWVVYPERRTKAPVVLVVHEIFGVSDWIRAVADQLAAEGFIAIAPDLLTMKQLPAGPDSVRSQAVRAAIMSLESAQVQRHLGVVARYAMALPAAQHRYGIVGFCWGGSASFQHAVHSSTLGASVVYYGASPRSAVLSSVRAPVLGLYGSNDARVNVTIPPADSAMKALGKTFTYHIYEGAGHGFLRQQSGQNGANFAATRQAWPATIAWFRRYLGS